MRQSKAKYLKMHALKYVEDKKLDIRFHRTVYQSLKKLWNSTPRKLRIKLFA